MPTIYFDNFRGFDKTFLSLKSVNFFVGENSTGKTSVLKIIKFLSDPAFWFTQDFNKDDSGLGYFSEIASQNGTKKYFEIGLLPEIEDENDKIYGIKMRFTEVKGLPFLKEIFIIHNTVNIQVSSNGSINKYKYKKVLTRNITNKNREEYFKKWIKNNGLNTLPYKTVKTSNDFGREVLIFNVYAIIAQIFKGLKGAKPPTFIFPSFIKELAWLAPIRTEPKRTYDSYKSTFTPDGTHAPYLLKHLLNKNKNDASRLKIERILKKFGQDSGLFEKVDIKLLGSGETAPFEIQICFNNNPLKITNVGYGVSQILPLVIEIISREKESWFAIQQPEIHLHPKGQAAFGDLIFKSCLLEKKSFIVETHSDFTIDRFRLKLNRHSKISPKSIDSQVVFFNRKSKGNELTCISIDSRGNYDELQPIAFKEFFIKEELDLLKM